VALIDALLHRWSSPCDLNTLARVALCEHRQQNDPAAAGDVVRDPCLLATAEEPEFAQLSFELPRKWLAEVDVSGIALSG
jgi:hypothetical protein